MNGKSHRIRRMLTAVALSAAAALLVVPLAQARLDDWSRSLAPEQPQATQPSNLTGDFMFRDYFRNATRATLQANDHILDVSARDAGIGNANGVVLQANDHVLDVSARDAGIVPSQGQRSRGDLMYRNYQLSAQTGAAQANDNILDVSAREAGPAPFEASTSSGTDWQRIGIGVAGGLGGVLLLAGLVFGIVEVRHTRHRLGSA